MSLRLNSVSFLALFRLRVIGKFLIFSYDPNLTLPVSQEYRVMSLPAFLVLKNSEVKESAFGGIGQDERDDSETTVLVYQRHQFISSSFFFSTQISKQIS